MVSYKHARLVPILLLVAGLTIPRLLIDYGADGDAARGAVTAERLAAHGEYRPSRLPGNPLFEYLLAALVPWGKHFASNSVVFLSYLASVAAFSLLLRGRNDRLCLTVMFALTPVVLLNAATTMDYVPGLALLLWSYLYARQRHLVLSALLLALAVGFRLSNALFVLPVGILFLLDGQRLGRVLVLLSASILLGLAFYLPIMLRCGLRMFQVPAAPYGSGMYLMKTVYNALNLLGPLATAGLLIALVFNWRTVVRSVKQKLVGKSSSFAAELTAVAVFAILFLMHSDEVAYLLPAVPWAYLMISRWIPTRQMIGLAVLLASFSVFTIELKGGRSGQRELCCRPDWGEIVADYRFRRDMQLLRKGMVALDCPPKTVVMTGMGPILTHDNQLLLRIDRAELSPRLSTSRSPFIHKLKGRQVYLVYALSQADCDVLRREGYSLCMFSIEAPSAIKNLYKYDPYEYGIEVIEVTGESAFYRRTR